MTPNCFCLPANFLQRDVTRFFIQQYGMLSPDRSAAAEGVAVLLWAEFGSQQKVRRPLASPITVAGLTANQVYEQISEDRVSKLIEARVTFPNSLVISSALRSGFLSANEAEDKTWYLELAGFAECNPHLMPGYKSIQKKGNDAMQAAKARRKDGPIAEQQRQLIAQQGKLAFEASPEEVTKAIAMIMHLDRIANRAQRITGEYESKLIEAAITIGRQYTQERIDNLLQWMVIQRDDKSVIQGAESVIYGIKDYFQRSDL